MVTRYNTHLGIPDKLFTIGDKALIQIMSEINVTPILVMACRVCPKNIEGTMFAVLMATWNLGDIFSK